MYHTLGGARTCAKSLYRLLEDSGILYPLTKCQMAVAKAGNFRDWHELVQILSSTPRLCEATGYNQRLLRALPIPCRQPVLASIEQQARTPYVDGGRPPYWMYDVLPYITSAILCHRRWTSVIRMGSGKGQKLREGLVLNRLMNMHDGASCARLDPDSLALVYTGSLEELFDKDFSHPRFAAEFTTLLDEGVFDWTPGHKNDGTGTLRVNPPTGHHLVDEVVRQVGSRVEYWLTYPDTAGPAADTLRQALACLGIPRSAEIAEAIVAQGAKGYSTPSGPSLDLLSDLAVAADLETFARAFALFAAIHPNNVDAVRGWIPAKIGSGYFAKYRQLPAQKLLSWDRKYPHWKMEVVDALVSPDVFVRTVESMAKRIEALAV